MLIVAYQAPKLVRARFDGETARFHYLRPFGLILPRRSVLHAAMLSLARLCSELPDTWLPRHISSAVPLPFLLVLPRPQNWLAPVPAS